MTAPPESPTPVLSGTPAAVNPAAVNPDHLALSRHLAKGRRERLGNLLFPVLGILGLLLVWAAVIRGLHVRPFIAPSPALVFHTLVARRSLLFANLLPTAVEAVAGFLLGNAAALLVAALFVHSRVLRQILFPVAVMLNAIPVVAKAPILVLILGNGLAPKITIAAFVCFFPTLVNMVEGLGNVDPQVLELMGVLSASRLQIFTSVRLPNSLPYLFSSLRIAASMAVIGAVVGEWIGSTRGIGALILQATYAFDTGLLYAAILMSTVLAGLMFLLIAWFEHLTVFWPSPTSR